MSGISFGIAYVITGTSQIGAGFAMLNSISQNFDPALQSVIMIVSAALAIYSVFRLARFFREVYENRLYGIVIAALGFFGSLIIILGLQSSTGIVLGVSFWLVGIIFASYKNKTKR
jgi:hypothetical protein